MPITTKINISNKEKSPLLKKGEVDLLLQDSTTNPHATVKKVNKGMQMTIDSSVHIDLPKELNEDLKYGKDFKIPDLPPQLVQFNQAQEAQTQSENIGSIFGLVSQQQTQVTVPHSSHNNQYKIKKFIDDIYQKEMKYRYHKQYVREDFLLTKSPIFDLSKSHGLRKQTDDVTFEYGLDDNNMLAFQAGGPNVKNPFS